MRIQFELFCLSVPLSIIGFLKGMVIEIDNAVRSASQQEKDNY
jgi:hypothetical protein